MYWVAGEVPVGVLALKVPALLNAAPSLRYRA
jgi:hypothetical protein